MALLIKGGMLMTMTERGSFVGDLLIRQGNIVRAEEHIDVAEQPDIRTLDASGHVILPGMIDAFVRNDALDSAYLRTVALSAGVTTALICDEDEERCLLTDCQESHDHAIRIVCAGGCSSALLEQAISEAVSSERRVLLQGTDVTKLKRGIALAATAGCTPILINPPCSAGMIDMIANSGCPVVLGVQRRSAASPWETAAALDSQGVQVAISTCYPAAKLKLLPVCASLCVRDGMARENALRTITSNPAAILGLHDRGSIAPGMRADLAIFDGDPLLLASSHVMTIAGGRLINRV